MFKKLVLIIMFNSVLIASDPITIDSLFKKQLGFRSITSLSYIASGNATPYSNYPVLLAQPDSENLEDIKQIILSESIIYTINNNFDILFAISGNFKNKEYIEYDENFNSNFKSKSSFNFDSFWLGGIYTASSLGAIIPQITIRTAILQNEEQFAQKKSFYFQSYSAQFALKTYSDPIIAQIYLGYLYNNTRKFDYGRLEYGNSIFFGFSGSIILSPKISLDLQVEQRHQSPIKFENRQVSVSRSLPTFEIGGTYSINTDTSVSLSASIGGSSSAPDSVFSVSLWRKF